MAYLPSFSGIDGALNKEEDDQDKLTRQGDPNAGGEMAAQAPAGGTAAAPSYTQSNFAGGKRILEKAQGAKLGVDLTADANQQNDAAQKALGENRANLATNVNKKIGDYAINDSQINDAIGGGQPSFNAIQNVLQSKNQLADLRADTVSPLNAGGVNNLSTQAGLQSQLQSKLGADRRYSRGMGSLDSAIYQKDKDFLGRVGQTNDRLANTARDINAFQEGTGEGSAADVIAKGQGSLDTNRQNLLDQLAARQTQVANQDEARKRAEMARQNIDFGTHDFMNKNRAQVDSAINAALSGYNLSKDQARDIRTQIEKSGNFKNIFKKNYGSDLIYTPDQAAQFNRINQLLGRTDQLDVGNEGSLAVDNAAIAKMADKMGASRRESLDAKEAREAAAKEKAVQDYINSGGPFSGKPREDKPKDAVSINNIRKNAREPIDEILRNPGREIPRRAVDDRFRNPGTSEGTEQVKRITPKIQKPKKVSTKSVKESLDPRKW